VDHLIGAGQYYKDQSQQIFRQRYKLFAEELGWEELKNSSQLDTDEFDHHHAVYIAVINDIGEVEGSCRISPSLYHNLSLNKLSGFFENAVPTGFDTWDCSRWVPGTGSYKKVYQIAGYMWLGLHEFCFNYSIKNVTGVVSPGLMNTMLSLELPITPLGTLKEYPEGVATGVNIKVSRRAYKNMKKRFKCTNPISIELTSHLSNKEAFTPQHFSVISLIMGLSDRDSLNRVIQFCASIDVEKLDITTRDIVNYFYGLTKPKFLQ